MIGKSPNNPLGPLEHFGISSGMAELWRQTAITFMKPNTTCRNCDGTEFYSHEVQAKGYMDLLESAKEVRLRRVQ